MSTELNLSACPFCGAAERADHANNCWFKLREIGASRRALAEAWNRRASPAAAVPEGALPRYDMDPTAVPERDDEHGEWVKYTDVATYARAAVEADRARQQDMSVRLAGAPASQLAAQGPARAWLISHGYGNQSIVGALTDLQARIDAKDREGMALARRWMAAESELAAAFPSRAEGGDGAPEAGDVSADRAQQGEPVDDAPEWIILQRPGCVPELKGPMTSKKQTEDMLRELYDIYPGCICTLAAMPRASYPQSGREWIAMYGDKRRKALPPEVATKAAAPADASSQQQEKVVRVAPAPAGQHGAGGADMVALHNAIMNLPCTRTMSHFATQHEMRAYKEGHRDARHAAAELASEATSRAQRTAIDKLNSAAPQPPDAKAGEDA